VQKWVPDLETWQSAFLDNCIFGVGAIVTILLILLLAWAYFARRLKGFGLDAKTMAGDFGAALVNLVAVWPLIMAAMIVTVFFAELIWGQKYEMERHQELNLIVEHPQLPLRMLIVVVAVFIAPVLEEMLFRGLFQTGMRSLFEAGVVPRTRVEGVPPSTQGRRCLCWAYVWAMPMRRAARCFGPSSSTRCLTQQR
jgi:membrane protease YdiL (CAAX protease family)